jgi:fructokinase
MNHPQVICFGETLWDLLPSGKVAGGAPMNVAFQLSQLGVPVGMISRIGDDIPGEEIIGFLAEKNIPTGLVQRDEARPTGIVKVDLSEYGQPQYEIVEGVAWDFIEAEKQAMEAVRNADAFVFGSLVARSEKSRDTLLQFVKNARFRVFDVNLRKPFFTREHLTELLGEAEFVKMNDEELDIISGWLNAVSSDLEAKMIALKNAFQLDLLVVTRGESGAVSLGTTGFCTQNGLKVEVVDTIGSGDAFLAGYLYKFLQNKSPVECLDFGCRMGAFVASRRGGTPQLEISSRFL